MMSAQPPTITVAKMTSHTYTPNGGDHGSSGFGGFTGQHFEQCGSSGIPAECRAAAMRVASRAAVHPDR